MLDADWSICHFGQSAFTKVRLYFELRNRPLLCSWHAKAKLETAQNWAKLLKSQIHNSCVRGRVRGTRTHIAGAERAYAHTLIRVRTQVNGHCHSGRAVYGAHARTQRHTDDVAGARTHTC